MTQFQKVALLIGALIVVLLIALVAVTTFRQSGETTIVVTQTGTLSPRDMTNAQSDAVYATVQMMLTGTHSAETQPSR